LAFQSGHRDSEPKPNQLLDERCLVRWETTDPDNRQGREIIRIAQLLVRSAFGGRAPVVLDPFAGGGSIPLEALRLGAAPGANDYNPVAYIIDRATIDYPRRYGVEGKTRRETDELGKTVTQSVRVASQLAADVDHWSRELLGRAHCSLSHLYPVGSDGNPVVTYLWARTIVCTNPTCRAEVPILRSLILRAKAEKVALTLSVDRSRRKIVFGLARGNDITRIDGTKSQRGPAKCLFCDATISEDDLRNVAAAGGLGERLTAVVVEKNGQKDYRVVEQVDEEAFATAVKGSPEIPQEYIVPEINLPTASGRAGSHRSINLELYGLTKWGQLFNARQLTILHEFVRIFREIGGELESQILDPDYRRAVLTYLAFLIDGIAVFTNTMSRWHPVDEGIKPPFTSQSIPMMWDYPEANPFSGWSCSALNQLEYIIAVLERERQSQSEPLPPIKCLLGSASELSLSSGSVDCIITDPPYGNSIAYADLSDFFYVWLKRSLSTLYPEAFATPQTPKSLETTSHKHRHEGSQKRANEVYQRLLTEGIRAARKGSQDGGLISVMFAHQSNEAWSALLSALFDAGLCPDATWPIATEKPTASLGLGTASLETSVTVVCRERVRGSAASFKEVRGEIESVVKESVTRFWSYGLRGADLMVSCYGPAVGVFGRYERVEKGDGTPGQIPELLELARKAARDAIAGDFGADNLSTLYYVWANLYGATDQSWDNARLVVQMGGDAQDAMDVARRFGIFVVDGSRCRLAMVADRSGRKGIGGEGNAPLIDALHRAMILWKRESRQELVSYLSERGLLSDDRFWKLAQSLFDVLPRHLDDWKLVSALLGERETLRTEGKKATATPTQRTLGLR
jgi:putative DNA methylase